MKKFFFHSQGRRLLFTGIVFLSLQVAYNPYVNAKGNHTGYDPLTGAGNLILVSGGTLNNLGTLVILGNLTNNGTDTLGSGTIKFTGSSVQSLSGTSIFQGLEVNNAAGITIDGPTKVNGTLSLSNGLVTLGNNNLLLGPSASVAGTPDATRMIVPTGSGQVRKQFSGTGTFNFPLGDNTGVAEYSPVSLNFTSGTFAPDNWAGVSLVNAPYPGSTGSYLNRYWNISSNGITDFNCNAQFNYVFPADLVGDENDISCVKVDPGPSVIYDMADISLHQLFATGLSSFGIFTGRSENRILNITSIMMEGLYNGYGTMRKAYDELGERFAGDTADVINVELHNVSDYSSVNYIVNNIGLNTSGFATIAVPGRYHDWYYLTIKHRNSIETVSALPVDFSGTTISYAFDTQDKAYGNNLGMMIDGTPVIYAGDENQDGNVDGYDLADIGNLVDTFASGYIKEDINGDGTMDGYDLATAGNNVDTFVAAILP